jgi:hypothetical protein
MELAPPKQARRSGRLTEQYTVFTGCLLTRIVNGHPNSQINDLLPWAYTAALDTREAA